MPSVRVTVSDDTYRLARVRAAELGTSASAVAPKSLDEFASAGPGAEARERRFDELRAKTPAFSAGKRLSRADLYKDCARRR